MRKILFLLLVTVVSYGQTYQNPTYGTISTKTAPTVTTPPTMATVESTGVIGKIAPVNIPINQSPHPVNYTIAAPTLGAHLIGIDNKFGSFVQTTAGLTSRIWFTADQTTITAGTFYVSNPTGKGTVTEAIQTVTNDDNQKKYFAQDLISAGFPDFVTYPAGIYGGQLSCRISTNIAQQRYTVEAYKTNSDGTPIASGVTGAPVGALGVTVIAILDSGLINIVAGNITGVPVSGVLNSPISFNTGERVRYHVSAEKSGAAGSTIDMEVFYGSDYNSYYDAPVVFNTNSIVNASTVVGTTDTDALNTLNTGKENVANKATDFTTVNNTLYPSVQAVKSYLDTNLLHKTGNETKSDVLTLSDKLVLGESSGNQDLIDFPGLNKLIYKEASNLDFDVKTSPVNPNSFFWKSNEGVVHQSLYFGDGDLESNIFGISASQDSGGYWQSSLAVNAGGLVGINNANPRYNSDVVGINRTRGVINSDEEISISPTSWEVTFTSPNLPSDLQQGYTYDGTYHYEIGTNRLTKYNYNYGTLIINNANPLNGIPGGVDHVGDGCYLNGFLYLPIENGSLAPTTITAQKIGKYNPDTLALITTYDVSAQNPSGASITTDGSILYMFEYYGAGNRILKYSITGTYLGSITIADPLPFIQGASYYNGIFYVGDQENLYTIDLDGSTTTLLRTAPGDVGLAHRAQGMDVVNGEIRWHVLTMPGFIYNDYYLNPIIGGTKKFKADVDGNVTATNIKFPSTQVVSTDTNTLDHYKEGTFTPVLEGLTSAGVGTYTTQLGNYTRIGNMVTASVNLTWTAHTGTGDMIIKGLPYTVRKSNTQATVGGNNLTLSANNYISVFGGLDTTFINIRQTPTGTITSATVPMDTSAAINVTITYFTDN